MNLQEIIRRILREEIKMPLQLKRRVNNDILDELIYTVKSLIDSGYDVSNEKWLSEIKNQTNKTIDPNALNWVVNKLKSPPKLTSLCRTHIRNRTGSIYLHAKLNELNIAKHLIEYLKMNNLS